MFKVKSTERKLGSCWYGVATRELKRREQKKFLKISRDWKEKDNRRESAGREIKIPIIHVCEAWQKSSLRAQLWYRDVVKIDCIAVYIN